MDSQEKLNEKIEELQQRIRELSRDDVFGVWTRAAFLQFCKVMPRGKRPIVFLDFDKIHDLNDKLGYSEVDRRIREILSIPFRSSDIIARWFSGDEIVILFDGDFEGAFRKVRELELRAMQNEMTFTYEIGYWDVGINSINETIEELSHKNRAKKKSCKKPLV